jgi:allantoin racemase
MAGLEKRLTRELGVPVIDGIATAVKLIEALEGGGIQTSK